MTKTLSEQEKSIVSTNLVKIRLLFSLSKKKKMKINKAQFFFSVLVTTILQVDSFKIGQISLTPDTPKFGEPLRLMCKSDSSFEYCIWRHKEKVCELQWKKESGSVITTVRQNLN